MTNKKTKELTIASKNTSLQIKDAAWNSLSEESKKAYSSDYKLFFQFINKDPKDITASDVLLFIEDMEKKEYKNNTINRKIASLSKMFRVMQLAGEIKSNPVEVLKQFKNVSHNTSSSVHIGIDLKDIKTTVKVTAKSTRHEKCMSIIIRTLAMTGLRISEFTGIKHSDIEDFDKDNKIITIVGKGKKERKIYFSKEFLSEVSAIWPRKKDVPYVFYNVRDHRYDRKILWKHIKNIFFEKTGKDVHPHLLRHFFATYKINVEKQDIKAVSKFLGHSDVSITLNAYVDTALDVESSKIKI